MRKSSSASASALALALVTAMTFFTRPAGADDRYAAQIVAMDAGALLGGAAFESPPLLTATYALGAPIIHWVHGNAVEGFASLALRIVVPVVGAFAFRAATGDDDAMAWGAITGVLFVTTFDAAALARARAPQRPIAVVGGTF